MQTYIEKVPPQHQNKQPGETEPMNPKPVIDNPNYKPSQKLTGKTALITGGDSGIGAAAAIAFAKEGADVAIVYLNEHKDAENVKKIIENLGRRCLIVAGDIGDESFCVSAVNKISYEFGKIDILVNNAGEQHPQNSIENITKEQLMRTFSTNLFGMFYITKASLAHMPEGSSIINTSSITAYQGSKYLIDYASTKGAITAFTRSLALNLSDRKIRVNSVAPGPVWTPLISSSFDSQKVSEFGQDTPFKRPGEPAELAPAFVFLASDDSSYVSGEAIHINGGEIING